MAYRSPAATTSTPGVVTIGANIQLVNNTISVAAPVAGPTGPQGPQGSTGPQGPQGVVVGTSITTTGDVATTATDGTVIIPGMTLTPGIGTYIAWFNADYSTAGDFTTAQAATDTINLYNVLTALSPTGSHSPTFGSETILAGVYDVIGAANITGVLTLDGAGDPNALFVFRISAAFTTAALASIVLINGANAANVFWVSQGAASTGVSTVFNGTILVNNAAASTGATNTITGRLLSTTGAIAITTTIITVPPGLSVITLGILENFALFTVSGGVSNTGASVVTGDIGTNLGAITGFDTAIVNGTIYAPDTISAAAVFAIYQNGLMVANSDRNIFSVNTINDQVIPLQAIATVGSSEAIDVRSTVINGTLTVRSRILTLIKI